MSAIVKSTFGGGEWTVQIAAPSGGLTVDTPKQLDTAGSTDLVVIPKKTADGGEQVACIIGGVVVALARASGDTIATGEAAYWDDSNGKVTVEPAGLKNIGWFAKDYAAGTGTAEVIFQQVAVGA